MNFLILKLFLIALMLLLLDVWLVCLSCPAQGSCLQSEEHLSLQINLSARGDQPADLDKLKPYVIEHIVVLLVAPAAGPAAVGGFVWPLWFCVWRQINCGNSVHILKLVMDCSLKSCVAGFPFDLTCYFDSERAKKIWEDISSAFLGALYILQHNICIDVQMLFHQLS